MKNLRRLAFLALLSVFLSVPGCAHVQPAISTIVTCSGKTIPASLVDEVYTDIMTENWGDLALTAVPALSDGWADVVCIYDVLKGANPALVGHMEKLQAEHVELRVSLRPALPGAAEIAGTPATAREGGMSPPAAIYKAVSGDRLPDASPAAGGALRETAVGPKGFSYPGPSVASEQKNCFRECGDNVESIAPPGGCRCWRHVGSTWRWVAAR